MAEARWRAFWSVTRAHPTESRLPIRPVLVARLSALALILCTTFGCAGEQDLSDAPEYAGMIGARFRTKTDLFALGIYDPDGSRRVTRFKYHHFPDRGLKWRGGARSRQVNTCASWRFVRDLCCSKMASRLPWPSTGSTYLQDSTSLFRCMQNSRPAEGFWIKTVLSE